MAPFLETQISPELFKTIQSTMHEPNLIPFSQRQYEPFSQPKYGPLTQLTVFKKIKKILHVTLIYTENCNDGIWPFLVKLNFIWLDKLGLKKIFCFGTEGTPSFAE